MSKQKGVPTCCARMGRVGQAQLFFFFRSRRPKNPLTAPKARLGWERLRSLAPSREAKQNIFQFLLEEKGSRAKIEKREKCFALHRHQAGGAAGRVNSVQSRFALRSVIATKLDIESFRKKVRARFARALGGFYSDFPQESAIRPTNPSRLFCPADGGSGARSA